MDITELDFILLIIIGYGMGVATGLCYCVKYRNAFLTRSKSLDSFREAVATGNTTTYGTTQPPVIQASAPPSHNPVKLTIE